MLRKAAARALWLTRGADLFGGSVVTLALVLGVASAALGANGQNFILGSLNNTATAITKLTGNVNGPAMQVQNTNAGTNDTALSLNVQPGEAPMRVNSATKVTDLNADKLDGLDSGQIGEQEWAVVNADGSLVRGSQHVAFSAKLATGIYEVDFDDFGPSPKLHCAYVATTSEGNGGRIGVQDGNFFDNVIIYTYNGSGTSVDLPFHLIVVC